MKTTQVTPFLDTLPFEVLISVFEFLDYKDFAPLMRTSKKYHAILTKGMRTGLRRLDHEAYLKGRLARDYPQWITYHEEQAKSATNYNWYQACKFTFQQEKKEAELFSDAEREIIRELRNAKFQPTYEQIKEWFVTNNIIFRMFKANAWLSQNSLNLIFRIVEKHLLANSDDEYDLTFWRVILNQEVVVDETTMEKEYTLPINADTSNKYPFLLLAIAAGRADIIDEIAKYDSQRLVKPTVYCIVYMSPCIITPAKFAIHVNRPDIALTLIPWTNLEAKRKLIKYAIKIGNDECALRLISRLDYPQSYYFYAIEKGAIKTLKFLIAHDPNLLSCKNEREQSGLELAIMYGQEEIALWLLNQPGNDTQETVEGKARPSQEKVKSLLDLAIRFEQDRVAAKLLRMHYRLGSKETVKEVTLKQAQAFLDSQMYNTIWVVLEHHIELLEKPLLPKPFFYLLLEKASADRGISKLLELVIGKMIHSKKLDMKIVMGHDIKKTVLQLLIENNFTDLAVKLIQAGANRSSQSAEKPLILLAIERGMDSVVEALLEKDPSQINFIDRKGMGLLMTAVRYDKSTMITILLSDKRGPERAQLLDQKDKKGNNALDHALADFDHHNKIEEVILLLLRHNMIPVRTPIEKIKNQSTIQIIAIQNYINSLPFIKTTKKQDIELIKETAEFLRKYLLATASNDGSDISLLEANKDHLAKYLYILNSEHSLKKLLMQHHVSLAPIQHFAHENPPISKRDTSSSARDMLPNSTLSNEEYKIAIEEALFKQQDDRACELITKSEWNMPALSRYIYLKQAWEGKMPNTFRALLQTGSQTEHLKHFLNDNALTLKDFDPALLAIICEKMPVSIQLSFRDSEDENFLMYAAKHTDLLAITMLTKAAEATYHTTNFVNLRNRSGKSALTYAIENKNLACVHALLTAGAEVSHRELKLLKSSPRPIQQLLGVRSYIQMREQQDEYSAPRQLAVTLFGKEKLAPDQIHTKEDKLAAAKFLMDFIVAENKIDFLRTKHSEGTNLRKALSMFEEGRLEDVIIDYRIDLSPFYQVLEQKQPK